MDRDDDLFADAARVLLAGQCSPQVVRAVEQGDRAAAQALWAQLEGAGFADALVAEAAGGSGLGLAQVFGVLEQCGAQALPLPLGETMLARALLAQAGAARPAGSLVLAEGEMQADGSWRAVVRSGQVADSALVRCDGHWRVLALMDAQRTPHAFVLDCVAQWSPAQVQGAAAVAIALPPGLDLRTLQACLVAALMAGALDAVFQRTLQYANERSQFGRAIGKFQAIQHQLAVMSEHVFAARMAAQLGCAANGPFPDRLRVATAKARCSEAALAVAETAHSIHGAIGFTEEFDLQLLTRRLHAWRQAAGSESYWHGVAGEALLAHRGLTLDLIRTITDVELAA